MKGSMAPISPHLLYWFFTAYALEAGSTSGSKAAPAQVHFGLKRQYGCEDTITIGIESAAERWLSAQRQPKPASPLPVQHRTYDLNCGGYLSKAAEWFFL